MKINETQIIYRFKVKENMLNEVKFLHGGELVKAMDQACGFCTSLFSKKKVLTVSINNMLFLKPARFDDLIRVKARIIYTGSSSMIVETTACILEEGKEPLRIAKAFFSFVAVDDENKPTAIPKIEYVSEEEKQKCLEIKKLIDFTKVFENLEDIGS